VDVGALLDELFSRIPPLAREAVAGLDQSALMHQPTDAANPIAWLVWHTARVQDHHVADVMGTGQLWVDGDWASRHSLAPDPENTGYGHEPADVRAVVPGGADDLTDYLDAVAERTAGWLATLTPTDLDRVVDTRWDPPVTLGVRLVSIADDGLQHVGQAAYLRGLARP
jgi:uncharacterized damage-inducible protein DinB